MVELILENEQDKEELTPEIEKAIKDVCSCRYGGRRM